MSTRPQKGRAVQPYRPGLNRAGEVAIPACDLTTQAGRTLTYHGRTESLDVGGGMSIVLSQWESSDGLRIRASLDPLPHLTVKSKPRFLHLSISRPDQYPGWDEMVDIVEALAGPNLDMAMMKPRRVDYVSPHPNCFHWWELPVEWGLR